MTTAHTRPRFLYLFGLTLMATLLLPLVGRAQSEYELGSAPSLEALIDHAPSELRQAVHVFSEDWAVLERRYDADYSEERFDRLRAFYETWLEELDETDFEALGVEGRIDYLLLEHELRYQLHELDRQASRFGEMEPLMPFASTITRLFTDWREDPEIDPRAAADSLAALNRAIEEIQGELAEEDDAPDVDPMVAYRAAGATENLAAALEEWYEFYDGFDPNFTWWTSEPYEQAEEALEGYAAFLRREIVGIEDEEEDPIIGDPIGAEAMEADLIHEMIPYSPEELIAIAEEELAWSEEEMIRASREMGHGDDWHAALEEVKTRHVEPGEQPRLVQELAEEAVDFVRERDLLDVPPLAEEVWRMTMLSPEWQRTAPFFLGGEVVRIAFPAEEMTHEEKLMSIRGNNRHFSRAVVHHELIPGHHLQGFMANRYNDHRGVFSTPFWGEGWALYWEMLLWDEGFAETPEDRIGMLFWRMHRAARIIFSLSFHLGEMTPEEAIDFLVERVGHERANAEAEVRRSFAGDYPPLYQAAYMLGGLQLRALHEELVQSGEMTNRDFHDAILRGGRIPIEMVRARLLDEELPRDFESQWRFYGDPLNED